MCLYSAKIFTVPSERCGETATNDSQCNTRLGTRRNDFLKRRKWSRKRGRNKDRKTQRKKIQSEKQTKQKTKKERTKERQKRKTKETQIIEIKKYR